MSKYDRELSLAVREVLRDWKHETFTRWKDGIDVEVCTSRCKKCQIEAALALPLATVEACGLCGAILEGEYCVHCDARVARERSGK